MMATLQPIKVHINQVGKEMGIKIRTTQEKY